MERFGESVMVDSLPESTHPFIDPITELVELMGPDKQVYVIAAADK